MAFGVAAPERLGQEAAFMVCVTLERGDSFQHSRRCGGLDGDDQSDSGYPAFRHGRKADGRFCQAETIWRSSFQCGAISGAIKQD